MVDSNGFGGLGRPGQRDVTTTTPEKDFRRLLYLLAAIGILLLLVVCNIAALGWRVAFGAVALFLVGFGGYAVRLGVRWMRGGQIGRGSGLILTGIACAVVLIITGLNLDLLKTFWPAPEVKLRAYGQTPEFVYSTDGERILENGQPIAGVDTTWEINGHQLEVRTGTLWVDDAPVHEWSDEEIVEADVVPYIDGKPARLLGFIPLVFTERALITWNRVRAGGFILAVAFLVVSVLAYAGIGAFYALNIREMLDSSTPAPRDMAPWYVTPLFWVMAIFDRKKAGELWKIGIETIMPPEPNQIVEKTTEVRGVRVPNPILNGGDLEGDGPAWAHGSGTAIASIYVPESKATSDQLETLAHDMNERNRTEVDEAKRRQFSRAMGRRAGWTDPGWRDFCDWMLLEKLAEKPNSQTYQLTAPAGTDFLSAYGYLNDETA